MIPANLRYQSKVESAPARRYLTQIQPQGGSNYLPSETITINIPTRNNTALIPSESYLKGSLNLSCATASATAATFESCGVHAFIQRIRVFHGSNLLEDIDNYAQLAKLMFDFQAPDDTIKGRFSVTSGCNGDYTTTTGAAGGNLQVVRGVNRGAVTAVTITTATAVPFAINLISLVGSLAQEKYLLLHEMTAAPLRVEIVLKPSVVTSLMSLAAATTASQTFTMTGVNYVGEFLELNDSSIAAIKSGSSSPMQMVLPSYRSYTNSAAITTAGTQVSFPIPAKFSSLKNIVVASRTSQGADGLYPMSHCRFGLQTYNFRVGSEVLPSTQPSSVPEFYNETLKCFGSIADLQLQPSTDLISYQLNVPNTVSSLVEASTLDSGSFAIGIDMEIYQATSTQSIFAGTNTNNSDIFFIANYVPAGNVTLLQTAFAAFDQVLVFENGVAYARY